jgi:hypothetical protein
MDDAVCGASNVRLHFGCAQTRASRRMWCLAARGLVKDRAHPGPPTPCRVASECKDTPEVERMTHPWGRRGLGLGVAGLSPPSCIRKKGARHAIGQYRGCLAASCQRAFTAKSGVTQPSPTDADAAAGGAGPEKKKARIHADSGPLRTELGGLRYGPSSPGCTWSFARREQPWLVGLNELGALRCSPFLIEARTKAARTNARRPGSGRRVLMAKRGVMVGASVEESRALIGLGFRME